MNCGHLPAGRPAFGCWQTNAPGPAAICAAFIYYTALTVALGINDQHCFAVFQEHGGRMSEILPGFPVHNHLPITLA